MIPLRELSPVRLDQVDPAGTGRWRRDEAKAETEKRATESAELREVVYAASRSAMLLILQGMDAGGKDGTVHHIL